MTPTSAHQKEIVILTLSSPKGKDLLLANANEKSVISTAAFAYFANAQWRDPCICLFLCLFLASTAHAQGCAQCLDSTQATPPSVQAAYRHAILLLAGFATTFFAAGVLMLRRLR